MKDTNMKIYQTAPRGPYPPDDKIAATTIELYNKLLFGTMDEGFEQFYK